MILQRDTTNRKLQQQQYRQQLYNSIQQKQVGKNKSRVTTNEPPVQSFSLIKNIEYEQEKRKNKQKQYYAELERQRFQQLQMKKKRLQQQKKRQLDEDRKIEKQNQMLKQRYEEEKRKQLKKQDIINERAKQMNEQFVKKQQQKTERKQRGKNQARQAAAKKSNVSYPQDSLDQIYIQNQWPPNGEVNGSLSRVRDQIPVTLIYPNRIQNQQFNFPQRRILSTNYYRDLQYEKRKLQQQANELKQFNRYLDSQKSTISKRSNQGLQSLKQLQKLFDEKNANMQRQYVQNPYQKYGHFYRSKTQNSGSYGYFN